MSDPSGQFDIFPRELVLHRIMPETNTRRFYRLSVSADLFGNTILTREWGRIGTRGQSLVESYHDEGAAISALMKRAAVKRRRGYHL